MAHTYYKMAEITKPTNTNGNNTGNKDLAVQHNEAMDIVSPSSPGDYIRQIIGWFNGDTEAAREYIYSLLLQHNQNENEWAMMRHKEDYDSTSNQLKRWIEAGGNPNAFFQQGAGATTGAPTGTASGTTAGSAGAGNMIATLAGARDTMRTGLEASRQYWENENLKQEAKAKEITNTTLGETNRVNIEEAHARIKKMQQDGLLSEAQTKQIDTMLPHMAEKTQAEIGEIKAKTWDLLGLTQEAMARIKNLRQDTAKKLEETLAERWRNKFRKDYNIDPNSPPITQLIQWLTSKNNIETAADTLTEFFSAIGEDVSNLGKTVMKGAGNMKHTFDDWLHNTASNIGRTLRSAERWHKTGVYQKERGGHSGRW